MGNEERVKRKKPQRRSATGVAKAQRELRSAKEERIENFFLEETRWFFDKHGLLSDTKGRKEF